MGEFLKKFGQGLLYILALPVFLVALIVYAIYGVLLFVVVSIITIVNFFRGRPFNSDLPEDLEAKKRLGYLSNPFEEMEKQEKQEPIYVMSNDSINTQTIEQQPEKYHEIEDAPQTQIEHYDIPSLEESNEEEEEIDIPETNFEEEIHEETIGEESEEILPMDDMEDDHIFSDGKDWWNK